VPAHVAAPVEESSLPLTRDQTCASNACASNVFASNAGGSNVVRIDREAGIASAAELKQRLLTALASGREIQVELDPAADVDVTWVQLLWAAEVEAKRSGVAFTVSGQVPEQVSAALRDAGFAPFSASGPGE
jgi:hypothetical protein